MTRCCSHTICCYPSVGLLLPTHILLIDPIVRNLSNLLNLSYRLNFDRARLLFVVPADEGEESLSGSYGAFIKCLI